MLAATGVLEFVDQQMADSIGDGLCGIDGEFVFALKDAERDLRDLGKVGGGSLGKDDAKLGGSTAQKSEARADDLPFRVGISDWNGLGVGAQERRFEAQTEAVKVLLTFQHEIVHPAVAVAEHFHGQVFNFAPVVIAPIEEGLDGCAKRGVGVADLFERAASGAAIEFARAARGCRDCHRARRERAVAWRDRGKMNRWSGCATARED